MTLSTHTVLVEAHAGGDLLAAANSWSAIVASAAAGADRIELDLRRTADGGFVLLRGERLADGRLVAELGRRELEQVRVGDEPLALLEDVLAWARVEHQPLVFDVKSGPRADPSSVLRGVGELVASSGASALVTVASYDHSALAQLRDEVGVRTRALLRGRPIDLAGVLAAARTDEIALFYDDALPADAAIAHALGLDCVLVGLSEPNFARALELDVDVVSWGDPAAARAALDSLPDRAPTVRPTTVPGTLTLLSDKRYGEASVFQPAALLRHARRQRQLPDGDVPPVCLLDPDGDIVRHLRRTGRARALPSWACYHTELDLFELGGREIGVVGCAVGSSFAVLVAEQLAASGCELVVSITSAGRIGPPRAAEFLLIDRALRDEGTSHHYLPPGCDAALSAELADSLADAFGGLSSPVETGTSWTTDAPFRETRHAIDSHARAGVACVEMEAAALYAYAQARGRRVVCIAHLTNEMGESAIDFEKGVADGADDALAVLERVADRIDLR